MPFGRNETIHQLEQAARDLEQTDPQAAKQRYHEAAAAWRSTTESAFTIAAWLRNARRSDVDRDALLAEAQSVLPIHGHADAVRQAVAWVQYDAAREAEKQKRFDTFEASLVEMITLFSGTQRAGFGGNAAARLLARGIKSRDATGNGLRPDEFASLRATLMSAADFLLATVEWGADTKAPSAGEMLLYGVRRLGMGTGDGALLCRYMDEAVTRYPRNEWFHQARIRGMQLCKDIPGAVRCAQEAAGQVSASEAVAFAGADAAEDAGDVDAAIVMLQRVEPRTRKPWVSSKLAGLLEQHGDFEGAAQHLARGLSFQEVRDPGKVWKLHHLRSRCLLMLGQVEASAREAWLAREARQIAGWGLKREQAEYLESQREVFAGVFATLDALDAGQARREALRVYRGEREAVGRADTVQGRVLWFDAKKPLAMVEIADGSRAIVTGGVLKNRVLQPGQAVKVKVVPSFDAKKQRPGFRVSWMEGL